MYIKLFPHMMGYPIIKTISHDGGYSGFHYIPNCWLYNIPHIPITCPLSSPVMYHAGVERRGVPPDADAAPHPQ